MGNIISSELFEDGSGSNGKDDLHTQSKPERKRKRSKTLRRKQVVEYYHPSQDENEQYNADEESEDTHISRSSSNSRIEEPEHTANYTPTTNRKKRKPSTYKNRVTD